MECFKHVGNPWILELAGDHECGVTTTASDPEEQGMVQCPGRSNTYRSMESPENKDLLLISCSGAHSAQQEAAGPGKMVNS